jgi:hypothetical protein
MSEASLYGSSLVLKGTALLVAGTFAVVSCGDSAGKRKVQVEVGGAAGAALAGAAGLIEPAGGAGGAPVEAGGAPTVVAGAGGELASGGAGGQAGPACSPETCPEGVCIDDVCEPETIVAANVNLSLDSLTPDRDCAESIAYSVLALSGSTATLASAPAAGCLGPSDEVLLINLQGTPSEHNNVGRWELLRVSALTDADVTFTSAVARRYGTGVGNMGLGTTPTTQRVALVRVPRFGRLVVAEGVTVTANAWDGALGGVLALRAAQLDLAGSISAAALGYRGGRWSVDDITCSNSMQTEAGESIGGRGVAATLRNLGASGGIGAGSTSFNSDNAVVATPGHSQAGEPGFNPKGRTIGEVGAAYGAPDATALTLGSGPGGALTCVADPPGATPYLNEQTTGRAGGIALLLADDLQIQPTGSISASPPDEQRDIAFAGGYVFLSGRSLSLGEGLVTALGSIGHRPLGPFAGQTNRASPGYVVLAATNVSGTTDPPALSAAARAPGLAP